MSYHRRPSGEPWSHFQTITSPETQAAFKVAAKRQRLSLGIYLDRLLHDLTQREGGLPDVSLPGHLDNEGAERMRPAA